MNHWAHAYIGKPWQQDAEGPAAFDCKGLVRAVQRARWGREVPALQVADTRSEEGRAAFMDAVRRGGWARVQAPAREGDILVCQGARGAHVGVFVQVGRRLGVLHSPGMHDQHGRPQGRVVWQEVADLLASGYGRPEVWRWS